MNLANLVWIGFLLAGAALLLPLLWTGIKWILAKVWPSASTSTTATVIDTASDYTDEVIAWSALKVVAMLFKRHGDQKNAELLGLMAGSVMKWDDKPSIPPTIPTP